MRLFIILWCLTFSSFAAGIIGDIILHTGNAVIERNDGEDVEADQGDGQAAAHAQGEDQAQAGQAAVRGDQQGPKTDHRGQRGQHLLWF